MLQSVVVYVHVLARTVAHDLSSFFHFVVAGVLHFSVFFLCCDSVILEMMVSNFCGSGSCLGRSILSICSARVRSRGQRETDAAVPEAALFSLYLQVLDSSPARF